MAAAKAMNTPAVKRTSPYRLVISCLLALVQKTSLLLGNRNVSRFAGRARLFFFRKNPGRGMNQLAARAESPDLYAFEIIEASVPCPSSSSLPCHFPASLVYLCRVSKSCLLHL